MAIESHRRAAAVNIFMPKRQNDDQVIVHLRRAA
jgi:hypothetical protein